MKRVIELWGNGLEKVKEDRAKHLLLRTKIMGSVVHVRDTTTPSSVESARKGLLIREAVFLVI